MRRPVKIAFVIEQASIGVSSIAGLAAKAVKYGFSLGPRASSREKEKGPEPCERQKAETQNSFSHR